MIVYSENLPSYRLLVCVNWKMSLASGVSGAIDGHNPKIRSNSRKSFIFFSEKKYFFCGQVWTLSVIKLVLILYQIFQSRKLEKKCDSNRRLFSRRRLNVYAGSTRKSRYFSAIKSLFDNFFSLIIFACLFYFGSCFLQPLFHLYHNHLVTFYDLVFIFWTYI